MLCIQCGTQNGDTTRFCTRCGLNLENLLELINREPLDDGPPSIIGPKHAGLILVSVAFITIIGLLTVFITIGVLATQPSRISDHDLAPMLVFLGIGGLAGICLIVKMLLSMVSSAKSAGNRIKDKKKTQNRVLPITKNAALPPQSVESFGSVIEHTTRNLPDYDPPQVVREEPRHHTK
ncbi:MAG TPA: zinc ribbon domain-containing protein [Blastocatellia bacterium]|nr:zinc ribbon domain-containing protein [Blastocatellia bacterium]